MALEEQKREALRVLTEVILPAFSDLKVIITPEAPVSEEEAKILIENAFSVRGYELLPHEVEAYLEEALASGAILPREP